MLRYRVEGACTHWGTLPALLMMRLFSSTICDGSGRGGRSSRASVTTSRSWSEEHSTEAEDVVDVDNKGELRMQGKFEQSPSASSQPVSSMPTISSSIGSQHWTCPPRKAACAEAP